MTAIRLTTYRDLTDHALDWLGALPQEQAIRDSRRATLNAYRDLASAHLWTYYYARGRLALLAPYQTGTISYDHTGGPYERLVTLAGGTWPAWVRYGTLVVGVVAYEVSERISDTQLTLTATSNPGDDLAAGQIYTLYRDTYPLPVDCLAIDSMILVSQMWDLTFERVGNWLSRQQIYRGVATPRFYCLRGDPNYFGALAVSFFPPPDSLYPIDFVYQRRPRPLLIWEDKQGSASIGTGSTTLAGTNTDWRSALVGSVVRLSADGSNPPTGPAGSNPARLERVIMSVGSATSLTLDEPATEDLANVLHVISDPVDVEEGAMLTALMRGVEYQVSISRNRKDREQARAEYLQEVIRAREADSRSFAESSAGGRRPYPARLAFFPGGPDVS